MYGVLNAIANSRVTDKAVELMVQFETNCNNYYIIL